MMIKLDSSSLIISLKMDYIDILIRLYGELVITKAVNHEVIIMGKKMNKPKALIGEILIKEKKIKIHEVEKDLMDLRLGLGETEIIHNSIEQKCPCLIEDKKAKRIGENLNVDVRSISISLLEAYLNKLIDDNEFEDFLIKWVRYATPSYDEVYFVKKMKELII